MKYVDLRLTLRETQILELVGAGLSDRELGKQLGITAGTVKVYGSKLRAKLAAIPEFKTLLGLSNSRVGVALVAISLGMANVPEQVRLLRSLCDQCQARLTRGLEVLEHNCFPSQGMGSPETSGHDVDPHNQKG